ncbi:MAG: hypothetical protein QHJ74_17450 [Anaerolineae bacterium]|nr:hypothetical protein [Anaerolineae bacterium]
MLGRFVQADPLPPVSGGCPPFQGGRGVPEPGNPQGLNRYAYVYNNPVRYTDPSGMCIPGVNCPGDVSGVEHPGEGSNLYGEAYAAWLVRYILWQEQQRAETGGMLDIELGQQAAAFELSSFLMKDPELLGDILYQQVAAAAPQLTAQAAGAATDVLISGAGWALGMVREAWQQGRSNLPGIVEGTRVSWPSRPHNLWGGHWDAIEQKVQEMAASGEYSEIYVNKAVSTATGGEVQSRLRPDIIGVRKGGGYDVFEVKSPSQEFKQLQEKIRFMRNNLFGALMVNGEVIEP